MNESSERPSDPSKRKTLKRLFHGGLAVAGFTAVGGIVGGYLSETATRRDKKRQKSSEDMKWIKGDERMHSTEVLNAQIDFLNDLLESDVKINRVLMGRGDGLMRLINEKFDRPDALAKITDNDKESFAQRRIMGWYHRSERLNHGFTEKSLRQEIKLQILSLEQQLAREKAELSKSAPDRPSQ
ncbi:MAG: hypothetical protein AAB899_02750 [Patescibacteria group bacterium]|mgnify:CR=1 FL=1